MASPDTSESGEQMNTIELFITLGRWIASGKSSNFETWIDFPSARADVCFVVQRCLMIVHTRMVYWR